MNISEISLRRPVFAIVLNLIILLFGIIGFKFLGVREYPAIDPPLISVRASYPGANADIIESQITEPLEKAINSVPGIRNVTSSSSQSSSSINVEFELGVNMEEAANDVRDKVSQAARSLPPDLETPPVISKADASSDPILSMTIQSRNRNQLELTEFANNILVERLQTIPGVSSVQIWGEKTYAMRIWLNPDKMNAFGVTAKDIQMALQRESVEIPSGKVTGDAVELSIRTFGRLNTEEEFNNVIIKTTESNILRLRDVAEAVLGPENEETGFRESNVPMIAMAVIPQPGSNYVNISDEFYRRVEQIKKDVPDDFKIGIAADSTKFIKKSIAEVKETLLLSLGLVIAIILFFFRSIGIAMRPLLDIPVSLVGAFFIMYLFGFSINILTLLAIVLATGLVVDDGIVVTENIYKKIEAGMNKYQAAREGSKEIFFAVISTSITLAVVFLPIIFLQGFVGRLFREFGIVVAGAVLISALVSLTLTPVLNVKLATQAHHSWFYKVTEPFFKGMENGYRWSLTQFIKIRWMAFLIILGCVAIIYFIGKDIPSELSPLEDRSIFRLSVTAPEGTSYESMDRSIEQITQYVMDNVPERTSVMSMTAPSFSGNGSANSGFVRVVLTPPSERSRTQAQIVQAVSKNLSQFTDVRIFPSQEQSIKVGRRSSSQPVQFVIQNNDFEKIKKALPLFLEEIRNSQILQNADADLKFNKPELRIQVDRLKASELGVSIGDLSEALQLALSNRRLGYFIKDGKQYQVIGQVERKDRDDPSDLKSFYVRNSRGALVSLDNLVSMSEEVTPPTLYHFNRMKAATISAGLAEGKTTGDGIKEMERISEKILDPTFTTALSGTARDLAESSGNTGFAFGLALILIFLVLAAQFESFIDPLIIMVTVPLAIAGALLSLYLFDQTLNIFSQIGMIMLIGLVTKNGILIVDFANKKQLVGEDKKHSAIDASVMRLRPILMTSLAMALGALPLALSLGEASTSRIPLGIVIVGGIIFSLILTLFVIPAIYTYWSTKKKELPLELQ
ncbi:MAG: efflux RND transporter permease subunit [Saprospiraceae bacterium]|nr:efflux RND transporter permease subunit [Saprospiraceae bacterium]